MSIFTDWSHDHDAQKLRALLAERFKDILPNHQLFGVGIHHDFNREGELQLRLTFKPKGTSNEQRREGPMGRRIAQR